jgi:hypothetical protein
VIARVRSLRWWQWLLVALTVAAVVYVGAAENLAAAIVAAGGIAAAAFAVWNPFAARPHPKLALQPVDGDETTELSIGEGLRPVDVESVVEDARTTALASRPLGLLFTMMKYAKPTAEDHAKYEADVETYAEEVRSWAQEAETWLRARESVLSARVIQRNPSSVDAEDAGVYVFLPPGTEEHSDPEGPPTPPERPSFPLRKSALSMALDPPSFGAHYLPRVTPMEITPPGYIEAASVWEADYERMPDGRLRVTYQRQPVRHGETEPTGRPFEVRLPPGDHEVRWEVHARNLSHHASGVWTVACHPDYSGDPITTLAELEEALGVEREDPAEDD